MTDANPLSAVGRTAVAVALARAIESVRPDAWFDDPLARGLEEQIGLRRAATGTAVPRIPEGLRRWVSVRTRFLDDLVLSAASAGVGQIVIVGAGLDARAFRLALAGVHVFEFDRADVLAVKQRVVDAFELVPVATRTVVTGDVMDGDWLSSLAAAGWDASEATLWIMEGFLIYFTAEVRTRLLAELSAASAPGSRLGATVSTKLDEPANSLWNGFDGVDFVEWFGEGGWAVDVSTVTEQSALFGRPMGALAESDFPGVLVDGRLLNR